MNVLPWVLPVRMSLFTIHFLPIGPTGSSVLYLARSSAAIMLSQYGSLSSIKLSDSDIVTVSTNVDLTLSNGGSNLILQIPQSEGLVTRRLMS